MGRDAAIHGSDVDDASIVILDHVLRAFSCHQEVRYDRCIYDLLPFSKRKLCGRADLDVSGYIDQDIDLSEVINDLLYTVDDLLFGGNIAADQGTVP